MSNDNISKAYVDRYAKMAIKAASHARHHHRLGAVIFSGGRVIATGWNFDHVHAEHAAIGRAWRSGTCGREIVVVRLRRDGSLGMAKPCKMCIDRLTDAGIKRVTYSDSDGTFKSMKLTYVVDVNVVNIKFRTMMWYKDI